MRLFNKVAVIGVGLIGGSLGLALKKKRLAGEVIGVSRHKKTLVLARKKGAIDKGAQEFDIIKGADLVILAAPVQTILNLAPRVSKIVKPDCIVIDVGSTKQKLVSGLEKIFPRYIGTHPLAGLEKRGVAYADGGIFKDSLCILTPTENTDKQGFNKIKRLWNMLGVKTVILSPSLHDRILSYVSHLPHLLAFTLIDIVPKRYLKFAASGFKDTTRIASSDSQLWTDIFLSNRQNMLKAIAFLERKLSRLKSAITRRDQELLSEILKKAKQKRDSIL